MSDTGGARRTAADFEAEYRESRLKSLIDVNLHTFWSIAIILLGFGVWDAFVDPAHWRSALAIRLIGAVVVVGTGAFQTLPGNGRWLPFMAKVRLVTAVVASALAAATLERGYGFGVAGLVAILLTGPYVAIDGRDLLRTNLAALAALAGMLLVMPLDRFDRIGTAVFALLAAAVSTLLGRALEASNRRAFALDLELHRDARTDALTGLANRRGMQERGRVELKRAKRSGSPVSVLLCDLDRFKSINDRYGHEAGDAALAQTAAVLRGALRESDALGRWGGEEFIAVLPATGAIGAMEVAERMRAGIANTSFDGLREGTTISLGVATMSLVDDPATAWDAVVKQADRYLYRAKNEGRNRVVGGLTEAI